MAYSVEHEHDTTEIVVLDDTGSDMDLNVLWHEGLVHFKQVNPDTDEVDLITITETMFKQLYKAYGKPEGFYR